MEHLLPDHAPAASFKGISEMSKPNNCRYIHFKIEDKHKYKHSGEFHSLKPSNTRYGIKKAL